MEVSTRLVLVLQSATGEPGTIAALALAAEECGVELADVVLSHDDELQTIRVIADVVDGVGFIRRLGKAGFQVSESPQD